jgi:hypothetical protein
MFMNEHARGGLSIRDLSVKMAGKPGKKDLKSVGRSIPWRRSLYYGRRQRFECHQPTFS